MRAVMFLAIGTLTTWLTMLAPVTILVCWYVNALLTIPLLVCAFIAPIMFGVIMHSLRGDNSPRRWWFMQAFGAGSLLMSLIPPAALLTLFTPKSTVAAITTVIWLLVIALAIRSAHVIKNTQISLSSEHINKPTTVVHISDVHIGSRSGKFLDKVVTQVNSHEPDLVLITGDLLDSSSVGMEDLQALASLQADTYMCLGNHERYVDLSNAITAIEKHNVIVLRSEMVESHNLQLIGIDDYEKPDKVAIELRKLLSETEQFRILLYHKPDGWQAAIDASINLMVAGHTHAGQIWPFGYLVKRQYPHMQGLFKQGLSTLYVSQGTGTWGPTMRLGTHSEMTVFTLLPKID